MKKSEFLSLLSEIGDDDEVQFESIIEQGRGCNGDFNCEVSVFYNDDDQNWRVRLTGDESSDSGFYD